MTLLTRICRFAIASLALFAIGGTASATIILAPSTPGVIAGIGYGPSNCEPGCVQSVFEAADLSLLYKSDAFIGFGLDEGPFAGSYSTWFSDTLLDPADALIEYRGGPSISCPSCYLAIKDGNSTPGYYFYNLSAWNGTEAISLQNFWPGKGAISHVSIWGRSTTTVPEPSTLSLFGLTLLAVGLARRRKRF